MPLPNPQEIARSLQREGRESVEDFIAALLCQEHPGAVQTNPGGGGDGGIDIYLDTSDGRIVWQVKAFHSPLNKSQMTQVKDSISRLVERKKKGDFALSEYVLVTPWTPTDAKSRTFYANAKALECKTSWQGAALINGLIAKFPHIYDALIHGEGHLERFVSERAILAATSPGDPNLPPFIAAVGERNRALHGLESQQAGDYVVRTQILNLAHPSALDEVLSRLAGVAHHVTTLPDGAYEVKSVVPNTSGKDPEPISVTTKVSKSELENNPAAAEWLYWGKPGAAFEAETQMLGGPLADKEPVKAMLSVKGIASAEQTSPPIIVTVGDGTSARELAKFTVAEVTRGPIGGGLRVLARSHRGAFELEMRSGSSAQPESTELRLAGDGGQDPCEYLTELGGFASVAEDDTVRFKVVGKQLLAAKGLLVPDSLEVVRLIARAFCEWTEIALNTLRMPRLQDITREDADWTERVRLALRGDAPREKWTSMWVRIGDPVAAQAKLQEIPVDNVLVIADPAEFEICGVEVRLARVLTQSYVGLVPPSADALQGIKTGDKFVMSGTADAEVVWSRLVDDDGVPVTEMPVNGA